MSLRGRFGIDNMTGKVCVELPDPDFCQSDDMDFDAEHVGHTRPLDEPRNCSRCMSQRCRIDGRCA